MTLIAALAMVMSMPNFLPPSIVRALDRHLMRHARYETIVLKRNGAELAPQNVRLAKLSQREVEQSEYLSVGDIAIRIFGETTLNIQVEDTFTWDNKKWSVVEPTVIGFDNVTRSTVAKVRA